MPNIILLGPPGCGKGTQASLLKQKYNFLHISTGDLIRKEIEENSSLGRKLREYFSKGLLVPDTLVNDILRNAIDDLYYHTKKDFILDGYPRTLEQHNRLEEILNDYDIKIDYVIYFKVEELVIIERLSYRRVCSQCNTIYHVKTKPSKVEGYCDQCNGQLIQRDDDKEEAIQKRLLAYNSKTTPLLDLYKSKNILHEVDANKKPDDVFNEIVNIVFKS